MRQVLSSFFCVIALAIGSSAFAGAPATGPEVRAAVPATAPAPAPAHADAHDDHGGSMESKELSPVTFLVTVMIFVCLFLVLSKTAWKPIKTGLDTREKAIRDAIESAKKAKEDAERTTKELEARMAEAQRQGAQQLAQAKADALKIAETIRTAAEAESAALKDRTLREIEAAKQQAVSEINNHAAELGTAVARKILQRNVTADDQQRLVEQSLSEMAKKN
jgi:F-type H+-transporting ATPase subunit b